MVQLLQGVADKIVIGITAVATLASGVGNFGAGLASIAIHPANAPSAAQTAIIQTVTTSPVAIASLTPPTPALPGLLPDVTVSNHPLAISAKASAAPKTQAAPPNLSLVSLKTVAPPTPAPAPQTITAQWILSNTTTSLTETQNGPYELSFATPINGNDLLWNLTDTTIGGTGNVPEFNVAFSCDPEPVFPDVHLADQNPQFGVDTSYSCAISLTPLSGADQQTQSKTFSVVVPAGELILTPPTSMNTVLATGQNNGGIVFTNQDSSPVTIESLTFDVSYTALTTAEGPLVLRFVDPKTGKSLGDYHLETLPETNSSTFTYGETNVTLPVSFTVGAANQEMLPIEILDVNRMSILNDNPTVAVTIRGVTTNENGAKVVLNSPTVSWTCEVTLSAYDPNATSGPFASGQACTQ